MAEAHARMRLSNIVTADDCREARRLQREAIKQAAIDPVTGTIDISILTTAVFVVGGGCAEVFSPRAVVPCVPGIVHLFIADALCPQNSLSASALRLSPWPAVCFRRCPRRDAALLLVRRLVRGLCGGTMLQSACTVLISGQEMAGVSSSMRKRREEMAAAIWAILEERQRVITFSYSRVLEQLRAQSERMIAAEAFEDGLNVLRNSNKIEWAGNTIRKR
ncbi:unnamed protein product [Schistocephalus solidus]|uniref:MCM domain-containing protein n=1 Tax=Schistocephalus solidus TaxID=70667 RepID=A0A3P7EZX6_SCHSO|nr:unnamed protein product [Schistocephalus solidus]